MNSDVTDNDLSMSNDIHDAQADRQADPESELDRQLIKQIVEALIMASDKPLSIDRMLGLFDEDAPPSRTLLKSALEELKLDYSGRGIQLVEVASGFRFQTSEDVANWVTRLWDERPQKYSRALLETLALIAYRQPITRGEIEEVRGVAVSSQIMKTLLERQWVKVVGHREVPGRPAIYATTKAFLDYFNLKTLEQLPPLSEMRDIDAIAREVSEQLELAGVSDQGESESADQADSDDVPQFDETTH